MHYFLKNTQSDNNKMNNSYETPCIEIVEMEMNDVITTSGISSDNNTLPDDEL